jgi:transposase InsO family protein
LSVSDIREPQDLRLYAHYRDEQAFTQLFKSCSTAPADLAELGYQLVPGSEIVLRSGRFSVKDVSPRFVVLVGPDDKERKLSHRALLDLCPRILGINGAEETLLHRLRTALFEDRMVYLARRHAITPYLPGGRLHGIRPEDRSVRRWRDAYLANEREHKPGDLALFPGFEACGNFKSRIAPDVHAKLDELIATSYKKARGGHKASWLHKELITAKVRGEITGDLPTKRTIYRHCKKVSKYERLRATSGKRIASTHEPIHSGENIMGSPHGLRDWQIAHIDTTPLDLCTTHATQDTEIVKQSVCRMVDPFSGVMLATVLFGGAVKAMRIRDLILDCWRRHGRLPRIIVCDWGPEHNNAWLQKSCGFLGITLIYRPKSEPRKGAPIETTFSTTCRELIHNLDGNTQLLQKARLITKAMDPKQDTLWSSEDINLLLEDDLMLRNELPRQRKPSPEAIALATEKKFGPAPMSHLTSEQVRIGLLPFVDGPQRKVSDRGTVRCFKKTFHSTQLEKFAGQAVDLRHDPKVPGVVHAIPPRGRRVIECHLYNLSGPADDIILEAELIDQKSLGADQFKNVSEADRRRAEIVAAVNAAQDSMREGKSDRRRKRPTRAATATPATPKTDTTNLLKFTLIPNA